MSHGNEFQRSDAATGNVRQPTVVSRNVGTSSWFDNADRVDAQPGVPTSWKWLTGPVCMTTGWPHPNPHSLGSAS